MFDSQQKYTGTQYTTTVALLVAAFVMSPAILLASGPVSYGSAIGASVLCIVLARVTWQRQSRLSIPSIVKAAR